MFKAFKNLNGVDLSKSLKKKRFQVMKLNHLPARTDECKFSFFPSAIFIYNSLIHDQEGVHTSNLAAVRARVNAFAQKLPWSKFS